MKKENFTYRIDERVFLTMAIIAVCSLLIVAFRYKKYAPCQPVQIVVNAVKFYDGFPISFKAEVKEAQTFGWDFGDNVTKEFNSSSATHVYEQPGEYLVTLMVDGRCEETKSIHIARAPLPTNNNLIPQFTGPDSARVNQQVTFIDNTPNATSWEWHLEEGGPVTSTSKVASFSYLTPGVKTIYLKINGRADMYALRTLWVYDPKGRLTSVPEKRPSNTEGSKPRIIYIPNEPLTPARHDTADAPRPQLAEIADPVVKKKTGITDQQIEAFLYEVASNNKSAKDFSAALCDNLGLPVRYNGKLMTFAGMCTLIEDVKRRRVKKITVEKIEDNGCITTLVVKLTRTLI